MASHEVHSLCNSHKQQDRNTVYTIQAPHFKLYCVIWYPGLIPIAARSGSSKVQSLECFDMVPHEIVRLKFTSESMLSI